ncbi:unnamed protein product [Chironomus riparius]|uniref:Odorant receptor n=1 Tax=Chironomus riparius TaxID=315576 RepID=A0A9N9RZA8_9DIPT|nr:unnamed protein product [Chironomus riparius]
MKILQKLQEFVKDKFLPKKDQNRFIEFSEFFISESIVNIFGLTSLPSRQSTIGNRWKTVILRVSVISLILLIVLSAMSMIIALKNNGSLVIMAENVCGITGSILMLAKVYAIFYYHREKIDKIINTSEMYYPQDNWNQQVLKVSGYYQALKNHEAVGITFYTMACIFYLGTIFVLQLYNLITSHELGVHLILQLYFPFDQAQAFVFIPLNIVALFSITSGMYFLLMTDLLFAELVALPAMEFHILGQLISEIQPADDQERALDDLKKLVNPFELTTIYQLYTPYDQNTFSYIIVNIIAMLSHSSGLAFIFMTDLLYAELVALTAMELSILGKMMSEIDPQDDQENALSDLKKFVKVHEDLFEVIDKLQDIFSVILFMDLFGVIGMMCTLAFLAFAGIGWLFFTRFFFLFLAASWNAFNHCFHCDRLSDASLSVADGIYNSSWPNGNHKYRKYVLIIMSRAQKAQVLNGLSFLDANLETFKWITNLTYSFYTVLVTLYESD